MFRKYSSDHVKSVPVDVKTLPPPPFLITYQFCVLQSLESLRVCASTLTVSSISLLMLMFLARLREDIIELLRTCLTVIMIMYVHRRFSVRDENSITHYYNPCQAFHTHKCWNTHVRYWTIVINHHNIAMCVDDVDLHWGVKFNNISCWKCRFREDLHWFREWRSVCSVHWPCWNVNKLPAVLLHSIMMPMTRCPK